MEKLYIPTHEELLEMGFTPREWEGTIYGYDFQALSYCILHADGRPYENGPGWWLSSWYQPWYPRSRDEVQLLISRYNPIQ